MGVRRACERTHRQLLFFPSSSLLARWWCWAAVQDCASVLARARGEAREPPAAPPGAMACPARAHIVLLCFTVLAATGGCAPAPAPEPPQNVAPQRAPEAAGEVPYWPGEAGGGHARPSSPQVSSAESCCAQLTALLRPSSLLSAGHAQCGQRALESARRAPLRLARTSGCCARHFSSQTSQR